MELRASATMLRKALRLGIRGARVWRSEGFPAFAAKAARRTTALARRMARSGPTKVAPTAAFDQTSYQPPRETPPYEAWVENNRWNEQTRLVAEHVLASLPRRPVFSVVMPVYNIEDRWLEKAVAS